jgi:hypothetical protein
MTSMSTPTNPGWRIQLAIHRAVRRDIDRLMAALGSGTEASAVRTYWAIAAAHLHHHHEIEDNAVWPLMRERLGDRAGSLLAQNAHEHQVMASAMDGFDAALAAADAGDARGALGRVQEATETHLISEEAEVLPLIPEAFTMEDVASFQALNAKGDAPSAFLPWLLDEAPGEDVAFFTSPLAPAVRDELERTWMPRWLQTVDAVRGRAFDSLGLRQTESVARNTLPPFTTDPQLELQSESK